MKTDPIIAKRFEELLSNGTAVLSTRREYQMGPDGVDSGKAEQWATSCISFLRRLLGGESEHCVRFCKHAESISQHRSAERALAVLRAAHEDYTGGYLFDAKRRIQAEVFDDLLEQAEYFLKDGYFAMAAVVAGAVLEDTLRKLCESKGITLPVPPKLDSMNAELAKAGLYDKLMQKKVTWLADIRNKAAHGKWTEFSAADAEEMLRATRRFAEDYSAGVFSR